jgi:hypothetical protein
MPLLGMQDWGQLIHGWLVESWRWETLFSGSTCGGRAKLACGSMPEGAERSSLPAACLRWPGPQWLGGARPRRHAGAPEAVSSVLAVAKRGAEEGVRNTVQHVVNCV